MGKRSKKKGKRITLTIERFNKSELCKILKQLLTDLSEASNEVRSRTLYFLNFPSELVRLEVGVTTGAIVPVLLKPSDLLLNLCAAVRTGNFDYLLVKYAHSVSLADSGLVDLPILPALETRQNGQAES